MDYSIHDATLFPKFSIIIINSSLSLIFNDHYKVVIISTPNEIFINELTSCKFIKDRRNITMLGNPGRGKTHMAIGLGLKACSMGMSVLFKNAYSLSTELSEAQDNYSLGKLEKRIQKAYLLILDKWGMSVLTATSQNSCLRLSLTGASAAAL